MYIHFLEHCSFKAVLRILWAIHFLTIEIHGATKLIVCLLWNLKNPVHIFTPNFLSFSSMPRTSKWLPPSRFSRQNVVWISHFLHMCYMPCLSDLWFVHSNIKLFGGEYILWRSSLVRLSSFLSHPLSLFKIFLSDPVLKYHQSLLFPCGGRVIY